MKTNRKQVFLAKAFSFHFFPLQKLILVKEWGIYNHIKHEFNNNNTSKASTPVAQNIRPRAMIFTA